MEQVKTYFSAEKNESLLFVAIGIIAIALSIYFFISIKKPFYNGMAYPLIAIALIQLTVGASVYIRSPKDIVRVEQIISTDKSKIQAEEIPRMEAVIKNFLLYRYIEIALITAGLILMFSFSNNDLLKGIGIGLFIQSAIMLSLDFFAERRGYEYIVFLKSILY